MIKVQSAQGSCCLALYQLFGGPIERFEMRAAQMGLKCCRVLINLVKKYLIGDIWIGADVKLMASMFQTQRVARLITHQWHEFVDQAGLDGDRDADNKHQHVPFLK